MLKKTHILFLLLLAPALVCGQNVKCNFTLNAQKVQSAGNEIFAKMKSAVNDFLNSNTWIDKPMQPYELYECNIVLIINEQVSEYEFKGTLQVQAQRPVYNSAYNSVTLNAVDNDVEFRFSPNEALDFSLMSHNPNNLTPLLAFWVYMMIGWDGDTFAPLGGAEAFRTVDRIVQNAQSESRPGWTANSGSGKKNRYALIESILSRRYEKTRKALYTYHRLGLDVMSNNFADGKKNILLALQDLQAVYKEKPDNTMYPIALFFDAKADEIVNIFLESKKEEKDELYTLLNQTNMVNELKYKRLKQ